MPASMIDWNVAVQTGTRLVRPGPQVSPREAREVVAELRTVLSGMPVAGFSGTLDDRFETGTGSAGRGVVRAKTGTLDGVNTLAGVVEDADGRLLAFAFMANRVPASRGDAVLSSLDTLAGTLAGCGCR